MKTQKINQMANSVLNQIENTLDMLYREKFIYYYNKPRHSISNGVFRISWNNHVSGRHNCGDSFTTINQYSTIAITEAYHAMLYDGSIIRVLFEFEKNILSYESLLYWPSPVNLPEDIVTEIGFCDALDLCITNNKSRDIIMRTPIRYDFDPTMNEPNHPMTHMHFQHNECRLSATKPICFNTFIKFVIKHFYPEYLYDLANLASININFKNKKIHTEYPTHISMSL